jgi:hypothetical protein
MEYMDVPLWVVQQRAPSVAAPPHHPFSTRATLILFTEAGWQFLQDAYQVKGEIETEYCSLVGEEGMRLLHSSLQILLEQSNQEGGKVQ